MKRLELNNFALACVVALAPAVIGAQQFGPPAGPGGIPAPPPGQGAGSLKLEWNKVAGAGGYIIEIQDTNGQVRLRRQTTENGIAFDLPVGEYRQRIGVLNKFKKVSVWSNWRSLIIKRPGDPIITAIRPARVAVGKAAQSFEIRGRNIYRGSKVSIVKDGVLVPFVTRSAVTGRIVLRLDTTTVAPGTYAVIIENPGGRRARSTEDLSIARTGSDGRLLADAPNYKKLVPGWHQSASGRTISGALWYTTYAGLVAGGVASFLIAEQAAAATASDPLYNLVFNPVNLFAIRDSISSRRQGLILAAAAYDRVIANQVVYQNATTAQGIIGGVAGLLYVVNYIDASGGDVSTAIPGANGPAWRGTLYWSLLGGLAAAGANEIMSANSVAAAAESDPLINMYSNPVWTSVLLADATRTDTNLLLAGLAASRGAELSGQYARHQQNQAAIGAAAALTYFLHFVDLSFTDAGLAMELQYVPEGILVSSSGDRSEGFTGMALHWAF